MVDTALLRPGRFDRIILTPVPDKQARLEVLKVHTKDMPLKDVDMDYLAEQTEGFVGADIEALCREAAMLALREDIKGKVVTADHFEQALMKVAPSVSKDVEQMYIALQDKFKAARAKEMKAEAKPLYFG
jgi:transitional endoplasmic reticulum ATPase